MLLLCVTGRVGMAVPRSLRRSQRPRTRRRGAGEPRFAETRRGLCRLGEQASEALLRPGRGDGCAATLVGAGAVVKVLLSPEEEAWVVPKAAAEGLSVQRFLVESALPEGRPSLLARRALYGEFLAARRDLFGACTNLNQLAHLGNQGRDVPTGVEASVAELEAAMERLVELAGLLVAHPKRSPEGAE